MTPFPSARRYGSGESASRQSRQEGLVPSLVLARASLRVPSWFYGEEVFPSPTGNHEFPKNGPRRDIYQCTGFHVSDQDRTPSSPCLKAGAFGLTLGNAARRTEQGRGHPSYTLKV